MKNTELKTDTDIARLLTRSWPAFFSKFGRLTEVQRQSIPTIMEGHNLLVCSATASGKTEAVCAPLLERCLRKNTPWRILYISPTRALVNDLYNRLFYSVNNELSCEIIRRTGDHKNTIRSNPKLIITTPESFDSLLCRGKIENGHILKDVVAVVMDEIHLLYGTARGEQLKWLLKRLQLLRSYFLKQNLIESDSLQLICLSATLPDPATVGEMYLGNQHKLIVVPGKRTIESISIPSQITPIKYALPKYIKNLKVPEKILVFSNKRKRVDELARFLKKDLSSIDYEVYAHHGSLSKRMREMAESALKNKDKIILVATSTLEIGIDIGNVDLVVLDGPPPDVSALLQRIGRGNRRTDKTRVMTCSENSLEVVINTAMIEAASQGDYSRIINKKNYGVIIQQLASYIFQSPHKQRSREKILEFIKLCTPEIEGKELLDHLLAIEEFTKREQQIYSGKLWLKKSDTGSIHSNIESDYGTSVIDSDTGETIATGINYYKGKQLSIGGNYLNVKRSSKRTIEVNKTSSHIQNKAKWNYHSKSKANNDEQSYCIRKYLNISDNEWPVLQNKDGSYIFHFGGTTTEIILNILSSLNPKLSDNVKINNWYLFFPIVNQPKNLSQEFETVSKIEVEQHIKGDLDTIENELGRPASNQKLPTELRFKELMCWLDLENEIERIKSIQFPTVNNQETIKILDLFIQSQISKGKI